MSMGLTNMHIAHVFFILCYVFTQEQCIIYFALYHKVALHYHMLYRFEIHSFLELSCTALFQAAVISNYIF